MNKLLFVNITKDELGNLKINFDLESALERLFNLLETISGKVITLVLLFILVYLIIKIGNKTIDKFVTNQTSSKFKFAMNRQKAVTVGTILKSTLKYGVYIAAAVIVIGNTFEVSPGVLSAIGFVVGIGAQSLVKDLINGFFIIFEDQYGVGDYVSIDQFSGIVEDVGIKTTVLRDFSGDLHNLSNGSITEITNHSRGDMRFIVDVEIAYEEDVDNAISIIENTCKNFEEINREEIRGNIDVLGVMALNASGVSIRVLGKAKPMSQWKLERDLRKDIKIALDKAGVEIPYSKTQIIMDKNNNTVMINNKEEDKSIEKKEDRSIEKEDNNKNTYSTNKNLD